MVDSKKENKRSAIQKLASALKIKHPQIRTVAGIFRETKQLQCIDIAI